MAGGMSADRGEERYQDILKRIAERPAFGSRQRETPPPTPHQRALDRVNAYDCLAGLARREYAGWFCYGPKALGGKAWAGVLIWAHRKGYHGYKALNLRGIWAHYAGDKLMLSVGWRQLAYSAPVYDPGVFRVAIASNFRIYYDDNGAPEGDGKQLLYRDAYRDQDRLLHRRALEEAARQWRSEMDAG